MSTTIICPNCSHAFQPEDAIQDAMKKQLRAEMAEWQKKKEEDAKRQMAEQARQMEQQLRKQIEGDSEVQMRLLQQANAENEAKLKIAREKEIAFIKKEQEILNKEKELDLKLQQMLLEQRDKLTEQIRKDETERNKLKDQEHLMEVHELKKQLEDQRKLAEEAVRKATQGSMQLQGEVQELILEEYLKQTFPFDDISEVGKGDDGADIVHLVYNDFRQISGKIVYESKRTKGWSDKWVEKLKDDMRNDTADIAVIVTKTLPKKMEKFGRKDGIWICTFDDFSIISHILRDSLLRTHEASRMVENVSDKKEQLYKYMTSNEFRQKWEAIIDTYFTMKKQLAKEEARSMKDWSERRKQLDTMVKNAMAFIGDVKGIGGLEMGNIKSLEENDEATHLLE